jgi:hypothetical protein
MGRERGVTSIRGCDGLDWARSSHRIDVFRPSLLKNSPSPRKIQSSQNSFGEIFLASSITMVSFKFVPALLLAAADSSSAALRSHRRLSYESIVGYEPGSLVTDHVSFGTTMRLHFGLIPRSEQRIVLIYHISCM